MVDRLKNRWWFWPLTIFLGTRLVTTALFAIAAYQQGDNYWSPAHPDYFTFLNIWDVEWYGRIFDGGYPTTIPLDLNGHVQQNAWAFLPLFPMLVKLTGLPWMFGAPLLATVFALGFALIAHRVFLAVLGDKTRANWALVFTLTFAASPVIQTGYSESLQLLAISSVLLLFLRNRLGWIYAILPVVAFSRPGVLAFAAFFGIIFLIRANRQELRFQLLGLAAWSTALGFAWPVIAGLVTGRADAYYVTEMAWRSGMSFSPFSGFIVAFQSALGGPIGVLVFAILVANLVYLFFTKAVRELGEVRWFAASYLLYLLAVFFPQSSTWRLLLPVFVLSGALVAALNERARRYVLVFFLITQVIWIWTCWMYQAPDYSPP